MRKTIFAVIAIVVTLSVAAQKYTSAPRGISAQEQLNNEYCEGLFNSTDGTILDVQSQPTTAGYLNILSWMQGRVAGFQVYSTRQGVLVPLLRNAVPGIYIDEVPVSASFLASLSLDDIAIVKVIRTPFYGGFNGANGAIAIYTKICEEDEEESE